MNYLLTTWLLVAGVGRAVRLSLHHSSKDTAVNKWCQSSATAAVGKVGKVLFFFFFAHARERLLTAVFSQKTYAAEDCRRTPKR